MNCISTMSGRRRSSLHENGKYKSSDIYGSPRSDPKLKKEYQEYLKKRSCDGSCDAKESSSSDRA